MSEIFDTLAKEYDITRNGDGWTIVNLVANKNVYYPYVWCYDNIDVVDWTYSIGPKDIPHFWFRKEADATMFTLKLFKDEVAQ